MFFVLQGSSATSAAESGYEIDDPSPIKRSSMLPLLAPVHEVSLGCCLWPNLL